MVVTALERRSRPFRMPPGGTGRPRPPLAQMPEVDGPRRHREDERARLEVLGRRAGEVRRVERPLGHRDVPGCLDEGGESAVRDLDSGRSRKRRPAPGAREPPPGSARPSPCGTRPRESPPIRRRRDSPAASPPGRECQSGGDAAHGAQWPAEIAASIRAFTWSTVKLAGSIRGGYSRNVLRNPPTMSAIG